MTSLRGWSALNRFVEGNSQGGDDKARGIREWPVGRGVPWQASAWDIGEAFSVRRRGSEGAEVAYQLRRGEALSRWLCAQLLRRCRRRSRGRASFSLIC